MVASCRIWTSLVLAVSTDPIPPGVRSQGGFGGVKGDLQRGRWYVTVSIRKFESQIRQINAKIDAKKTTLDTRIVFRKRHLRKLERQLLLISRPMRLAVKKLFHQHPANHNH